MHACFLYAHGFMLSLSNSEVPYFPFTYGRGCSALVVNSQELLISNVLVVIHGDVAGVSRTEAREQFLHKCSLIMPRWY